MESQMRYSVDRGWAWVVCAACFSIQFVIFGIIQSYGTIFIELIREFNTNESQAAWVGSLAYGLIFLSGPLSTALIEHFGCRKIACLGCLVCSFGLLTSSFAPSVSWMYLTFSIVWGLGASLSFFSSLLVLRFFFYHKLSLGNGIAMTGSAAGTLLLNLALGKMNASIGWRMSWRILSAFTAGSCVCGCAFLQPLDACSVSRQWNQLEKVNLWKKLKRTIDVRPWKNKVFLVYLTAQSFMLFGYFVPYVHLVRLAETRGIPTHQGSLLVGYLSVSQIFGKLLFGRLADHRLFNKVFLLSFAGFMLALSTACATLARNYGELIAFSLIFGFFDGAVVVVIPVITLLIVGREQMAYAFGGMYAVLAVPLTIGPSLSAVVYDYTGSYAIAFYASSSLVAVGVFLMYVVHRLMLSMVVRTNVWQTTREKNESLVRDGAGKIHVPPTGSAGGFGGMCLADVTSQARDQTAIDKAQIDDQSMCLSLIFPSASQIFCDPLSHLSYSVSNLSNATLSHDINLMAPSENGSTTSNVQSSPDIHSLVSVGELLNLRSEETKAENDELLRIALENLARKEKEVAPLGSTNEENPEVSDNISLTQQGINAVFSKIQEANATSKLNHADVKDIHNEETEISKEPQITCDDLHDKISIKSPVVIGAVLADNKAKSNTELETVRIPPPPETPRKNANLLVDLGDSNTLYMVNVENMDHSHLTSTSQSVPESLRSLQESLRSQQDTSINSSTLVDHCMFSDSAQVSALSERLEEVAAHRRSLEEAELTALLSNAEGTNANLHNEILSEADEEILQVRLPPPPSSSKRRSQTSSISYDSPVPSLVEQNQGNCTNLEQRGSEVDMICVHDERNRVISPDNKVVKDVHLLDFITKEQGNNKLYIYSPQRQENDTENSPNVFPFSPAVSEDPKTWQELEKTKTLVFQEENSLQLSFNSENNKTTALENSSLINVPEILKDTEAAKIKKNFSEISECLNIESRASSKTALSSFLSDRDKKLLDSTPKQKFWDSSFVPNSAEEELSLNDCFNDANVLLESSIDINQKLAGDTNIKEIETAIGAAVGVAEMSSSITAEKDVCTPLVDEGVKIFFNVASQLGVQNSTLENTTAVCQNTQDIVQSIVGTDGPMPGKGYSHFNKSTQTSEDILSSNNEQVAYQNSTVMATENYEETITKVESSTRKDRPFTSPIQTEMQTPPLINSLKEQECTDVSQIMAPDIVPAGISEIVEMSESNELPSCRPSQEKPKQMDQYNSTYEHSVDSEIKLNDVNNVSPASEYTNFTSVAKQLKLNPKIRVFNESEDESSAEEDIIINTNKELRELSGIEPLISGLEISTKEYFRDLERTRPRNRRPLSGSSSGSQSGYSTDTSVSESDSESINVYYFKIPEVSEPEEDS